MCTVRRVRPRAGGFLNEIEHAAKSHDYDRTRRPNSDAVACFFMLRLILETHKKTITKEIKKRARQTKWEGGKMRKKGMTIKKRNTQERWIPEHTKRMKSE